MKYSALWNVSYSDLLRLTGKHKRFCSVNSALRMIQAEGGVEGWGGDVSWRGKQAGGEAVTNTMLSPSSTWNIFFFTLFV
jgi:hypothetical protein